MPAPEKKTLIYDAFYRLDHNAELIAIWPTVELSDAQRDQLAGFLGSGTFPDGWVCAKAVA